MRLNDNRSVCAFRPITGCIPSLGPIFDLVSKEKIRAYGLGGIVGTCVDIIPSLRVRCTIVPMKDNFFKIRVVRSRYIQGNGL